MKSKSLRHFQVSTASNMTIKKNFDTGDFKEREERSKGLKNTRGVKNREEQRFKNALRQRDITFVEGDDEPFDDSWDDNDE